MTTKLHLSKHDQIKEAVYSACCDLGLKAAQEYKGKDWRADVYAANDSRRFAFEVQMTAQSLNRTMERQQKYIRDEVFGCWLFEKPPTKLSEERPDLPLFSVIEQNDKTYSVSLSGRKELALRDFLNELFRGNIKFCAVARAAREQAMTLVFYEMACWKCNAMNHLYYVEPSYRTACNAVIHTQESMWDSSKLVYRPEIVELAKEFARSEEGKRISLAVIKRRFSKTVQDSYMSFGCHKCDSIFGGWFVMEAELDVAYGHGAIATIERKIVLEDKVELHIPHWCYPGELPFCDAPISK